MQKHFPKHSCDESKFILELLGSESQAVTSAIIQLFLTDHSQSVTRRKHESGVLRLVIDSQRHSYFFQVYCIFRKQKVWEHEVENDLEYLSPKPFIHTFKAEEATVIFKFSSEDEGCQIRIAVMEILSQRKGLQSSQLQGIANIHKHCNTDVCSKMPTGDSHLYDVSPAVTQNPHSRVSSHGRNEQKSKRRLTKADIGLPQNFRHVSHVGWDPNKGFDVDNVEDPQLKQFFDKAGVSDSQLQDRETREFIYDFINRHGGLDAVKNELVLHSPPGPPPRPPPPAPPSPLPSQKPMGHHQPPSSPGKEDAGSRRSRCD